MFLSLQGYIRVGARLSSGKPGPMFWVGNVPEATLELSEEAETKNESYTGNRLPVSRLATARSGNFNATLDEWSPKGIAMGFYGAQVAVEAGSATDESFPSDLVAGDQIRLEHPYASSLVIEDSAGGTPATLVDGTDYRLIGHNASVVEILNVGSYTQPFLASYSYAACSDLQIFTQAAVDRWVLFDGINTETGDPILIDLFKVRFSPFTNVGLINAGYGSLPLTGLVQFDSLNVDANGKGGFAKIVEKAAA